MPTCRKLRCRCRAADLRFRALPNARRARSLGRCSILTAAIALASCSPNAGSEPEATASAAASSSSTVDDWPADLPRLEFHRRYPETGPPSSFILAEHVNLTEQEFIERYAKPLWGLSEADELVLRDVHIGLGRLRPDFVYSTYRQYHAGYEVEQSDFVLNVRGDRVYSCGGDPVGGLDQLNLEVRLTSEEAAERACDCMVDALRLADRACDPPRQDAELVIPGLLRRLAWRVRAISRRQGAGFAALVDASTGDVLFTSDLTKGVHEITRTGAGACAPRAG